MVGWLRYATWVLLVMLPSLAFAGGGGGGGGVQQTSVTFPIWFPAVWLAVIGVHVWTRRRANRH